MRYSITHGSLTVDEIAETVRRYAPSMNIARISKQVFVSLEQDEADVLESQGFIVSVVRGVDMKLIEVAPPEPIPGVPTYTPANYIDIMNIGLLKDAFSPPLTGEGINVAVMDTGIRQTHQLINSRVVYSKSFIPSQSGDVFDHGTGVASVVVAVAPEANILDIKVLDDQGQGTEEDVVMGMEHVAELLSTAPEIAPHIVNLSLGSPDEGNPNNPMAIASRALVGRGIIMVSACGNSGPNPYTVTVPATDPDIIAIGSVGAYPFAASNFSSRGPTIAGVVKPDIVLFGENLILASTRSDTATVAKSGTSFSCPMGTGILAVLAEGVQKLVVQLGGRIPGIDDYNLINYWFPKSSVKPQGSSYSKDNIYGWGVPLGDLLLRAMQPVTAVQDFITPMIMMAVVSMVMKRMR